MAYARFAGAGCGVAGMLILLLLSQAPSAEGWRLPEASPEDHLGVVTCAGSTCHGATRPFRNSSVLQNEFVTWHREDKHAQAYKVLLNDRSQRIARNLGLKDAQTARICLDCHADNVSPEQRGERFQLSDGVGCEACHGGSERWLGPHTSGKNSHQDNLNLGMYPTENPAARAELCLSCHLGTKDKLATHRIMGAGHPRLSFELDTFTDIEPPHFLVDEDYRKRKGVWKGAQVWAIGQLLAAEQFLALVQGPSFHKSGLFPELSFFDCHACHHPFNQQNWTPRQTTGLSPGTVRLNDANLLMLKHVVERFAPGNADRLAQATRELHQATTQGTDATQQAARRLQALLGEIRGSLGQRPFSEDDMLAIARNIVSEGLRGEYSDYAAAEQSVMALASLVNSLKTAGRLSDGQNKRLNDILNQLYNVLQDEDNYQPQRYITALKAFQQALTG